MPRRAVALLLASLSLASTFAHSADTERVQALEEVEVIGRVPGPPLWKVSKGEHVLWILPLVELYPKKMEWESSRVERLIRESQEFIQPPSAGAGIATANPLLLPRVMSLYNTMERRHDKKTLADDLPADLYQRFSILMARYFPKNDDIETKPLGTAARSLEMEILEKENLTSMRVISPKWLKANKSMVRTNAGIGVTHVVTGKELKALTEMMKELMATPEFAKERIACLEAVMSYFEKELDAVKRQANAWARGRLESLVGLLPLHAESGSCVDPLSPNPTLPAVQKLVRNYPGLAAPDLVDMRRRSKQKWLDAAESALARNASTFSTLTVNDIVDKTGLVAQLEAKGYKVEIFAQ